MKSLVNQATYLGYVVSRYGIAATDLEKVSAVADWTVPTNLKELQAVILLVCFIGISSAKIYFMQ